MTDKAIAGFAKALAITIGLPEDNEHVIAAAKRLAAVFHKEVVLINCIKQEQSK